MFSVRRIMWLQLGQRLSVNKIKQSKDWFIFEKLRFFIYYYLFSYKQFNQNQFDLCKFNTPKNIMSPRKHHQKNHINIS